MMEFLFILGIIFVIGLFVLIDDLIRYKDYEMWEDDTGFHMEKKNEQRD